MGRWTILLAAATAIAACQDARVEPCGHGGEPWRRADERFCLFSRDDVDSAGAAFQCPSHLPTRIDLEGAAVCTNAAADGPEDLPADACAEIERVCGPAAATEAGVADGGPEPPDADVRTDGSIVGDAAPRPDAAASPDAGTRDAATAECSADPDCDDAVDCTSERCDRGLCVRSSTRCSCVVGTDQTILPPDRLDSASGVSLAARPGGGFVAAYTEDGARVGVARLDDDGTLEAQWSYEMTGVALTTAAGARPTVAPFGDGYYVAWADSFTGSSHVAGRQLAMDASPMGDVVRLTEGNSHPQPPALAASGAEMLVVCFDGLVSPAVVRASVVGLDGAVIAADVTLSGADGQARTAAAWTGENFVAAWHETGVRVAPLGRTGARLLAPSTIEPGIVQLAGLAWTGAELVALWSVSADGGPAAWQLRLRRLHADGAPSADAVTFWDDVIDGMTATWSPAVGALGVVWARPIGRGLPLGIFFVRVGIDGVRAAEPVRVNDASAMMPSLPAVAPSATGFGVAWVDRGTGADGALHFARVECL